MTARILDPRTLRHALLARQLLLERATLPLPQAVDQVGGLQTQYSPSGYVGLWTRLAGFERHALTAALEDRTVIQATLQRVTIHMVSREAYWRVALGIREARRAWARRVRPDQDERALEAQADTMRAALADGPRTVKELGVLGAGFVGNLGLWVDLVRVPPSGTWERRRADRLALAEMWVGPPDATLAEARTHLVRMYLGAFGPAPWRDIAQWAGITVAEAREGGRSLSLTAYRDSDGRPLVDLADATLPEPGGPLPVRFLPHWDAALLVHARRTGLLPEAFRSRVFSSRNPFSVGTYLVDGVVAGAWSWREGRVVLDPFVELSAADRRAVEQEREALEVFHA